MVIFAHKPTLDRKCYNKHKIINCIKLRMECIESAHMNRLKRKLDSSDDNFFFCGVIGLN